MRIVSSCQGTIVDRRPPGTDCLSHNTFFAATNGRDG